MPRDLQGLPKLGEWPRFIGYKSSVPKEAGDNYLALGSENVMLTGNGKTQAFKGVKLLGLEPGKEFEGIGGIVMMNIAEQMNAYASIGTNIGVPAGSPPAEHPGAGPDGTAYGNAFNVYAALFFIGKGLLRLAGHQYQYIPPHETEATLVQATATLSLLVKVNGSYSDLLSGMWQAGLQQPSAPIIRAITPPGGFSGKNNGVVSVVCWRIRSTTGAVSIESESSNIAAALNESIAVTLPGPDANGQDYWGIGVTRNGEGSFGAHFFLTEIPETDVVGDPPDPVDDVVTNAASHDITSASGSFSSAMLGWVVTLSGGSLPVSDPAFETFVTAVPTGGHTLTLDAMPPGTSTGVHMVLAKGVEGTERTIVIEWTDGDLVGSEFAPTHDFPPPLGYYAGAEEDIVFVDGSYADLKDQVSEITGVQGSAIAPSEPGKPESFSPDSVIFTNDMPTGLIRGDGLYWRFGRNSCYLIRYLGGEKPLSVEIAWEGIGIEHQHNACLGEGGRLYAWPNERGPMRLVESGVLDGSFAADVADDFVHCTDALKRVVGWDGRFQVVAFCYQKTIWPWFTALDGWGAPADLAGQIAGDICSCVTENGRLLICDTLDNLYEYNAGNGSVMKLRTGWAVSNGGMDNVALVLAAVRVDNTDTDITIDVFADGDDASPASSISVTPERVGYQRLPSVWPNVQDCESHAIQITMTSRTEKDDCGVESIGTYGDAHSMLR